MAKLTMFVGVLLAALGITMFVITGNSHPKALTPVWFGLVFLLCGSMANTDNSFQRMLWMHIAVCAGLIGFVFPFGAAAQALLSAHQEMTDIAHPAAFHEEIAMAGICFLFTLICIRSFISARRLRVE